MLLVSGRYCRVCLHHSHHVVHGICLPKPGAKTSPVILRESQSCYQRKLNMCAKALMRWQMRPVCSLQAAQSLVNCKCWELLWTDSWKASLWPWLRQLMHLCDIWQSNSTPSSPWSGFIQIKIVEILLGYCKFKSKVKVVQGKSSLPILSTIFWMNWWIIWSIKCQKTVTNSQGSFLKPKVTFFKLLVLYDQ